MKRLSTIGTVAGLLIAVGLVVPAPAVGAKKVTVQTRVAPAQIAKKRCKKGWKLVHGKCKKKKKPPAVYVPPAPLALSDSEVKNRVGQQAVNYCIPDIYCYNAGIYVDYSGGPISCASRSTYEWACYGWNDEYDGYDFYTCDFREIVDRVGYSDITSHQDQSYGYLGWNCHL